MGEGVLHGVGGWSVSLSLLSPGVPRDKRVVSPEGSIPFMALVAIDGTRVPSCGEVYP